MNHDWILSNTVFRGTGCTRTMSAAVQKYKRVLYSTNTVDEEYKDMLYSGSTDSTGSSTVVARSQTVLCGHSSARLLSTPSLYSAHRSRAKFAVISPRQGETGQGLRPWLFVCRRGCTAPIMDYVVLDVPCRSHA